MCGIIRNFSGVDVTIYAEDGTTALMRYPSVGLAIASPVVRKEHVIDGVPVIELTRERNTADGLPDPVDGVFLIVPFDVMTALPNRTDLLCVGNDVVLAGEGRDRKAVGWKSLIK